MIAPNVYAFPYKVNDVNIANAQVSNLEVPFKYGKWKLSVISSSLSQSLS
jgi:hypothetical protein